MKPLALAVAAAVAISVSLLAGGSATASVDSLQQQSSDAAAQVEQLSGQLTKDRAGYDQASERAADAAASEAELSGQINTGAERVDQLRVSTRGRVRSARSGPQAPAPGGAAAGLEAG